jgi:hypothetical protein
VHLPVVLSWSDGAKTRIEGGFTRDVSMKGFFVICARMPSISTRVDLELLLSTPGSRSTGAIRATGWIARIGGRKEARGVAITAEISPEIRPAKHEIEVKLD